MSTDSKLALERWKLRKIAELGADGFEDMSQRMLGRGHLLHERIEHYLLHEDLPEIVERGDAEDDEISANHMKSIAPILEDFSKPLALESRVVHPELQYQGTKEYILDCLELDFLEHFRSLVGMVAHCLVTSGWILDMCFVKSSLLRASKVSFCRRKEPY